MNLESYSELVSELSKDSPNQKNVKKLCEKMGIPYNSDPIILMSDVLVFSDNFRKQRQTKSFTRVNLK